MTQHLTPEQRRFIQEEVKRQLNIIQHGAAAGNTSQTEDIGAAYPGMPTITKRPVMHPYGFVSRAVTGVISVVGQIGADIQNRFTMGHRDAKRPADVQEGETYLYSSTGYQFRIKAGKIEAGKGGHFEPMVLGDKLTALLQALITLIIEHYHMGNLGAPTSKPLNEGDFSALKTSQVDGDKLLVKDGGGF